jgi:GT2 family glycosyltransferase
MDSTSNLTPCKIVISIVNWNGFPHTARCIQSILDASWSNIEIVIIDNASRDDSVVRLRGEFPEVQVIRAETNLGFAGGHKLALDYALTLPACELFWMLNNDTRVLPETLSAFLEAYQQFGEAIYGGVPLNQDGTIEALPCIDKIDIEQKFLNYSVGNGPYLTLFTDTTPYEVAIVHGSNLAIALNAIRSHGFLDERFFLYGEEDDYCLRLRRKGVRTILVPSATVIHGQSESSRQIPSLTKVIAYYRTRNSLIFTKRHLGRKNYVVAIFKVAVSIAKSLFGTIAGPTTDEVGFCWFRLRGLCDALVSRMGKTIPPENHI